MNSVMPLAGDASTRKYYRIVQDTQTWVLMEWEEFIDVEKYPFISIQKHFSENGIHSPEIIAVDQKRGRAAYP